MEGSTGFQPGVIGALALSVASSVAIVICNKALISTLGFPFATTLTSWHLVVTFGTLYVAQRSHLFETKSMDTRTIMLFGLLNGVSIGLLNLSLGFNSVGFYQEEGKRSSLSHSQDDETGYYTLHGAAGDYVPKKQFSQKIKLSLLVLLVGVGIASVTDLKLNLLGSVLSLLAIGTTCVAQIMTNTIQKRLNVSSTQLLYQSAPFQASILLVAGPFVDQCLTKQSVFAYKYSPVVMIFIILSCLIAVSVNFSTFLVIGKTSPVTYQVLGHLKTCMILTFGYTLLHDPVTYRNVLGIVIAIVGMGLYSYFCTRESKKRQSDDRHLLNPNSQTKSREATPLVVVAISLEHPEKESSEVKKSGWVNA